MNVGACIHSPFYTLLKLLYKSDYIHYISYYNKLSTMPFTAPSSFGLSAEMLPTIQPSYELISFLFPSSFNDIRRHISWSCIRRMTRRYKYQITKQSIFMCSRTRIMIFGNNVKWCAVWRWWTSLDIIVLLCNFWEMRNMHWFEKEKKKIY